MDITRNYHGGNHESVEANPLDTDKTRMRLRILRLIRCTGPFGATSDEVEQATGISHQSCSARFTELKARGDLTDSGMKRKTRNGRNARVWIAL